MAPKTVAPLVLPPGVEQAKFDAFIEKVTSVVGPENVNVVAGSDDLDKTEYLDPSKVHDTFNLFDADYFVSSAVVCPRKVTEVQDLMRLANEFAIPVWPFSIGRNVGYGGAAPRVPGSIGIDMGRHMNRVIEVSEANAYALVEPGVTFSALYEHLETLGLQDKLWLDTPDLGGGSVLGNTSERGIGYTPYGDHFMVHCGMEVVLPSGELVRTGMGAMPNPGAANTRKPGQTIDEEAGNRCWQLFNYGFGPYHDGIFSQSNYGVITKMGIWLMPNPGGYQAYLITVPRAEDLHALIETIRQLRISMVIQNAPTVRHVLMDAACAGSKADYFPDLARPVNEEELVGLQEKLGLGRWNLYGALYGPDPVRQVLWQVIQASFSAIPGAKFHLHEDGKPSPGVLATRSKTMRGIPTYDELKWVDWLPNGAHLFFSPIAEVTGDAAMLQYEVTRKRVLEYGFDFIPDFCVGMREMHHIVCMVYNRESADERHRAHQCIRKLIDDCAAYGWGEYRTHLALMDHIAGTYSWNDSALMKLSETVKNSLDPNGILSPGKNGVWGAKYDKKTWALTATSSLTKK